MPQPRHVVVGRGPRAAVDSLIWGVVGHDAWLVIREDARALSGNAARERLRPVGGVAPPEPLPLHGFSSSL